MLVGAITPCGQCRACLSGQWSQCGHGTDYEPVGGWRFGNTMNGAQAEYLRVPFAQANLAVIPPSLRDEQVVLLADIASTGFSGAESAEIRLGDAVVVFAQGPIGISATIGARLMGASLIIGADSDPARLRMAQRLGADVVLDYRDVDVVAEVKRLTGGGRMWRSRRWALKRHSRRRCGVFAREEHYRVLACIRANCRFPTMPLPPASEITASSQPCVPAEKNACVD